MKKQDDTRYIILNIAEQLFNTFGYDKTSMDDIANSAHKAKRSIYNHFQSKEELFKSVVSMELEHAKKKLGHIFDNKNLLPSQKTKQYLIERNKTLSKASVYKIWLQYKLKNNLQYATTEPNINDICLQFDKWEHDYFVSIVNDISQVLDEKQNFDSEAFVNMLQMIIKSMETLFFVEKKYDEYNQTYNYMTNLIIDSIVYKITSNNSAK